VHLVAFGIALPNIDSTAINKYYAANTRCKRLNSILCHQTETSELIL
jgi:hypothetical protein